MKFESLAKLTFIYITASILVAVAAISSVVYVIWHFLARVW